MIEIYISKQSLKFDYTEDYGFSYDYIKDGVIKEILLTAFDSVCVYPYDTAGEYLGLDYLEEE